MKTEAEPGTVRNRVLQVVENCDANLTESLDQGVIVEEAAVTEETIDTCLDASSDSCTGMDGQFSCCDTAFPNCSCSDQASKSFCEENACVSEGAADLCCNIEMGMYVYPECAAQCSILPSPCDAFSFPNPEAPLSYGLVVDAQVAFICSDGPGAMLTSERKELIEGIMTEYVENLYDFYGCGDGITVDMSELNSFSEPGICTDPNSADRYTGMTFTLSITCVGRCPTRLPEEPEAFPANGLRSRRILNGVDKLEISLFKNDILEFSIRRNLNQIQCPELLNFADILRDCGNFTTVTDSIVTNEGQATGNPSTLPSMGPSSLPSVSLEPSSVPSNMPSSIPSFSPTTIPSSTPSTKPNSSPSSMPSIVPSLMPTLQPSNVPSDVPSSEPSSSSSFDPSSEPSSSPSSMPSVGPSLGPTVQPSDVPSDVPSVSPSSQPSESLEPSREPSSEPSLMPSAAPSISFNPSSEPSFVPSSIPTFLPSNKPSSNPSFRFGAKHFFPLDQANQFTDVIDGDASLVNRGGIISGSHYFFNGFGSGGVSLNTSLDEVWTISMELHFQQPPPQFPPPQFESPQFESDSPFSPWIKIVDFDDLQADSGLYFELSPPEHVLANEGPLDQRVHGFSFEGPRPREYTCTYHFRGGPFADESGVCASSNPMVVERPVERSRHLEELETPPKDVVVISKDDSRRLSLYVNGECIWQGTDSFDEIVFGENIIHFFEDDKSALPFCD